MQELLLSRGLKPGDVMLIFLEFDTSGDGAPHLAAHTAPPHAPPPPHLNAPSLNPLPLTPLSHPSHTALTPRSYTPTPLLPPSPTRTPPCTPHAPAP